MSRSCSSIFLAISAVLSFSLPAWAGPVGAGGQLRSAASVGKLSPQVRAAADALRGPWGGVLEQTKVYGRTYGEWSNHWVAWAESAPVGLNAIEDTTGAFCALNQPSGNVWFLAGTLGGPAQRQCTIPRGKALFYPLVEVGWIDCPNTPDSSVPEADIRGLLSSIFDLSTETSSTINGVSVLSLLVPIVRTQGPTFTSVLPANSIQSPICPGGLPAGRTGRRMNEGFWVMVPPLPPGQHTLTLRGAITPLGFENSVTYYLTVR